MANFVVGAEQFSAFVCAIMGLVLVVAVWREMLPPSVILKGWRKSFMAGMGKPVVSWWRALLCWGWMAVLYQFGMGVYKWELGMLDMLGDDSPNLVGGQYAFDVGGYVTTVGLTVTAYSVVATFVDVLFGVLVLIASWSVVKNGVLGVWCIVRVVVFAVLWLFTLVFSLAFWPVEWAWNNIRNRRQMRELKLDQRFRTIANQAIRDAVTAGIIGGTHGITEAQVRQIFEDGARSMVNREVDNAMTTMHDDRVRELTHEELDEYDRKVGGFVLTAIAATVKQASLKIPDPSATQVLPVFRHRMPTTPGGV